MKDKSFSVVETENKYNYGMNGGDVFSVCNATYSNLDLYLIRNFHNCHCISFPSTVKLGPSGWITCNGFKSVLKNPSGKNFGS